MASIILQSQNFITYNHEIQEICKCHINFEKYPSQIWPYIVNLCSMKRLYIDTCRMINVWGENFTIIPIFILFCSLSVILIWFPYGQIQNVQLFGFELNQHIRNKSSHMWPPGQIPIIVKGNSNFILSNFLEFKRIYQNKGVNVSFENELNTLQMEVTTGPRVNM